MSDIIITPPTIKQMYRQKYLHYLLSDDVDSVYHLYKICLFLMNVEKLKDFFNNLKKKQPVFYRRFTSSVDIFQKIGQYRSLISLNKDRKGVRMYYEDKIEAMCKDIVQVEPAIFYFFVNLVMKTDLKNIAIPISEAGKTVVSEYDAYGDED